MDSVQYSLPNVVSQQEWQKARRKLLEKEKELTRQHDKLNAERRRLPMVAVQSTYHFAGPEGQISLIDLFHGRRQLIVYSAMLEPGAAPCKGCSMVMDNIGHNLAHVAARDTSFVFTSPAPQEEILALQQRMNWNAPWYTDPARRFADTFDAGKGFAVNVFIRDDANNIYRTYYTTARGAELFDTNFKLLDLTPYGRQESWEDSPEGWPQTPPYQWWRMHDEYE
ncbi:DUF899 domain-containing protein [Fodinibius sediminis]|uniref:Predicted dithiol-disulfide oxidoreductase, DUF899 family n=1 Tax=Fodinibius sediminis TaxID=1214077 RepID=A0A521BGB0_9BACT|nr:DUF899 domain-containing protein [Fodinibius sediminis]SMO46123.1 Predicted dithiol-disulfide oxidoreductase, DUF899 family [Fodinibius sediminis]